MDVRQLVEFLAPFLTPLLSGASEAAAKAAGRMWEHVAKMWGAIGDRISDRPAAQEAARDVAADPEDSGARDALVWQLEKLLKADPGLRERLTGMWEQASAAGVTVTTVTASGERSVAVGGNVHGTIVTGDGVARPGERA